MKLSCIQENLSKGLGIVGRAVPTRTPLPAATHILMAPEGGRLKLAATNLEIAISCWIGAQIEEPRAIAVPARLFSDFVNSLPNDRIDLSIIPGTKSVQLLCGRYQARIAGLDAEDFPPIPTLGQGVTTSVEAEALRSAIARVVFAAATEESRPVLTGVHCRFAGKRLTLAAADGFRLAVQPVDLAAAVAEDTEVIIPASALKELQRLLGESEEPVSVTISSSQNQVLFVLKDIQMVAQLLQGTYPNYSQLIPKEFATRTVLDTAEFLRATRTASIFARDASGIVRLQATPGADGPGKAVISARADELGDNTAEIDATVEGAEAKIAFNSRYLMELLSVVREGQVALETTTPSSPGVVRPVGQNGYLHVIMPMFVQW
ncbi:MAG: DNA polymerase III subunit beta [Chloroflexi bacterium]|nr:DNA polymerase III subunit beta [Chloroflexota bacterium]